MVVVCSACGVWCVVCGVWCVVCGVVWCGVVCGVCMCVWWGHGVNDGSLAMPHHGLAPNSGRPCPCGHDPPGRAPVCRALRKNNLSSSPRR